MWANAPGGCLQNLAPRAIAALRFLALCLANVLSDLAQIENILGSTIVVSGLGLVAHSGNGQAAQIAGVALAAVGAAVVAIPKVIAVGKQAETDLEILLSKVAPKS